MNAFASTFPDDGQFGPTPSASRAASLAMQFRRFRAPSVRLQRTLEGRTFSRVRLQRAEEFMIELPPNAPGDLPDFLYSAGIVVQLALSSHLLDVGFPDEWCARHISLNVHRSLAFANATGLGYDCAETARLIAVLSPYWKWNRRHHVYSPVPDDGGFTAEQVRELVGALLNHVSQVTGHRPPKPS